MVRAAWGGQDGTCDCDRRVGRRWRDDSWESENPFLPLMAAGRDGGLPRFRRGQRPGQPRLYGKSLAIAKGEIRSPLLIKSSNETVAVCYCCSSSSTESPA